MPASLPRHRFYTPPIQIDGEHVRFSPEQGHQIADVLRLRPGGSVRVFDGHHPADYIVLLVRVAPTGAEGLIQSESPQPAEPRTRIVLRPSLLRRDAFEQVLDSVTQLGAAEIAPVLSIRCVARDLPDDRRISRWRSIVREAAEQSGRGVVPTLRAPERLERALGATAEGSRTLLAYEAERNRTLQDAHSLTCKPGPATISLFVGPEGGFEEDEVRAAQRLGAEVVSLGPRTLRAEVASPTFLALVLHTMGDL